MFEVGPWQMEEPKELQEKNLLTMIQLTQKYFLHAVGNGDRSLLNISRTALPSVHHNLIPQCVRIF